MDHLATHLDPVASIFNQSIFQDYTANGDSPFLDPSSMMTMANHTGDGGEAVPELDVDVETFWKDIYSKNNLQPGYGWKIPQYYSLPYQVIGTIFQGIIFIVGVLGNVMVVIVVLRSRSMRTPTNCYLVSLAVADTMVLLASVPNEIIAYYILGDKWIWGPIGCALFIFLQYLGINASSLSIAAFTVERYIAICHPMLAHKLCTVRRAKRIIMYVWMFATAYCAPWLFLTKTERIHYLWVETEVYTCKFKLNREHYKGYYLTDIVLFYVLPLVISCVLYALIARILYKNDIIQQNRNTTKTTTKIKSSIFQKSHNHHTTGQMMEHPSSGSSSLAVTPNVARKNSSCQNQLKKITSSSVDSSRVQVVKMLAVVVAVFATLWLPYRALVVYNSFSFPPYMELWYLMFAKTMIFVNSAINPIIYSACSMKFRREFKRMLTCNSADRNNTYRTYRTGGGTATVEASTMVPNPDYFRATLQTGESGGDCLKTPTGVANRRSSDMFPPGHRSRVKEEIMMDKDGNRLNVTSQPPPPPISISLDRMVIEAEVQPPLKNESNVDSSSSSKGSSSINHSGNYVKTTASITIYTDRSLNNVNDFHQNPTVI